MPIINYHSWGRTRETFDCSDMRDIKLPIPSTKERKSIVAIHYMLKNHKSINQRSQETMRQLRPVLMQRHDREPTV